MVYEVYKRLYAASEDIVDSFKLMDAIGIDKKDQLYCLDLVQAARVRVLIHHREQRGVDGA